MCPRAAWRVLPLAIFCAASKTVMAAGYALPLTASMKGVIPRASLSETQHTSDRVGGEREHNTLLENNTAKNCFWSGPQREVRAV